MGPSWPAMALVSICLAPWRQHCLCIGVHLSFSWLLGRRWYSNWCTARLNKSICSYHRHRMQGVGTWAKSVRVSIFVISWVSPSSVSPSTTYSALLCFQTLTRGSLAPCTCGSYTTPFSNLGMDRVTLVFAFFNLKFLLVFSNSLVFLILNCFSLSKSGTGFYPGQPGLQPPPFHNVMQFLFFTSATFMLIAPIHWLFNQLSRFDLSQVSCGTDPGACGTPKAILNLFARLLKSFLAWLLDFLLGPTLDFFGRPRRINCMITT